MPPTHSPSNIAKAHQCPSRLREYQDPPRITHLDLSKPTEKGTFYHLVIEQWLDRLHRAIQDGKWEDFTSFISRKKDRMNQLKGDGITVTSEYSGLLTELVDRCKIQRYLKRLNEQPGYKIKSIWTEAHLPSGVGGVTLLHDFRVKGFVDCIVETENNIFVIDWKTELHLKNEDEIMRYEIQLALYSRLAEEEYNVESEMIIPRLISLTQSNEKGFPLMKKLDLTNIGREDDIVHWTSKSKISGRHCSTCDEAYARAPCRERSTDEVLRASSQRLHDPVFTSGSTVIDVEIQGSRFKPLSWKSFFVSNGDQENERILHVQFSKARGRVEIPENCVVRCRGRIKFEDGNRTLVIYEHVILN